MSGKCKKKKKYYLIFRLLKSYNNQDSIVLAMGYTHKSMGQNKVFRSKLIIAWPTDF